MLFKFEKLADEPIVIATLSPDFDSETDMPEGTAAAAKFLDDLEEQVFWIVNFQMQMSINALLVGSASVTQGPAALFKHPNIREVMFVSSQNIVQMAAPGYTADAFGNLKIRAFSTLAEALEYARAQA